jgi:hypothetical protein
VNGVPTIAPGIVPRSAAEREPSVPLKQFKVVVMNQHVGHLESTIWAPSEAAASHTLLLWLTTGTTIKEVT